MSETLDSLKTAGKEALTKAGDELKSLVESQSKLALAYLKDASEVAGKHGSKILVKLTEITTDMASGAISVEDGEAALKSLWLGLDNLRDSIANAGKLQSYNRGRALLESSQKIAIGVVSAGLSMAAPIAGQLIGEGLAKLTKTV